MLNPAEHRRVADMVSSRQDPTALEATVQTIKAGLEKRGIKYEDISGRPKNLYGIWQKMLKDGVSNVDKVWKQCNGRHVKASFECQCPPTLRDPPSRT